MEEEKKKYSAIGGQALIEGVMMRNKNILSIAIRRPNGEIVVTTEETKPSKLDKLKKMPIVRGGFNLISSMIVGTKALTYSAEIFAEEDAESPELSKFDKFMYEKLGDKAENVLIAVSLVIALGLAIGLFTILPTFIMSFARSLVNSSIVLSLFEGMLKIILFLIYITAISQMEDIKRVFQYHGAEHQTIACHEAGMELTPENAKKCSRLHPRCGTSFLVFVMIISIILYSFLSWESIITRIIIKLLLLPVIAGIAYEMIRLAGKSDNQLVKILSWPGMQLQKLTTRKPDESQLEVAIAAFKDALEKGGE